MMFLAILYESLYLNTGQFFLNGKVLIQGRDVMVGGSDDLVRPE